MYISSIFPESLETVKSSLINFVLYIIPHFFYRLMNFHNFWKLVTNGIRILIDNHNQVVNHLLIFSVDLVVKNNKKEM